MLRRELEEKDSMIAGIVDLIDQAIAEENSDNPTLMSVVRNRVQRLKRWP